MNTDGMARENRSPGRQRSCGRDRRKKDARVRIPASRQRLALEQLAMNVDVIRFVHRSAGLWGRGAELLLRRIPPPIRQLRKLHPHAAMLQRKWNVAGVTCALIDLDEQIVTLRVEPIGCVTLPARRRGPETPWIARLHVQNDQVW